MIGEVVSLRRIGDINPRLKMLNCRLSAPIIQLLMDLTES